MNRVLLVESVQEPDVLPGDAPNVGASRRERRFIVARSGHASRRQRTHGRRDRTIRWRACFDPQPLHAPPKRSAYSEDSLGHGHSPAAMCRSSASTVISMKSPLAKSCSARRSSSSSELSVASRALAA